MEYECRVQWSCAAVEECCGLRQMQGVVEVQFMKVKCIQFCLLTHDTQTACADEQIPAVFLMLSKDWSLKEGMLSEGMESSEIRVQTEFF